MEQLQEAVRAAEKCRVIGSAHSFTPLVAAPTASSTRTEATLLLSLRSMPRRCVLQEDEEGATLTVDAGTTFSEVRRDTLKGETEAETI